MSGVLELPMVQKRPVTVEEYRKLKQRDLTLRCQYVKLLQSQRKHKNNPEYAKRIRKLEKRIAELELRLAYSELILPEPEPLTLRDILGFTWRHTLSLVHAIAKYATVKKLTARY